MRPFTRRLIFVFSVVIFFLASPIIVAYAVGYRFDMASKHFLQIGMITANDVMPADAVFSVDGKDMPRGTFSSENLSPGTYRVRISRDGYMPWEATVPVYSRTLTRIHSLTLFPDTFSLDAISAPSIITMAKLPQSKTIVMLTRDQNGIALMQYDTKSRAMSEIRRFNTLETSFLADTPLLLPSSDGERVLIMNQQNQTPSVLAASAKEVRIVSALPLFPKNVSHIEWSNTESQTVLIQENGTLLSYDLRTNTPATIASSLSAFSQIGDRIFAIQSSDTATKKHAWQVVEILNNPFIKNERQTARAELPSADTYTITPSGSPGHLIIKNTSGGAWIFEAAKASLVPLADSATDIAVSPSGAFVLTRDSNQRCSITHIAESSSLEVGDGDFACPTPPRLTSLLLAGETTLLLFSEQSLTLVDLPQFQNAYIAEVPFSASILTPEPIFMPDESALFFLQKNTESEFHLVSLTLGK